MAQVDQEETYLAANATVTTTNITAPPAAVLNTTANATAPVVLKTVKDVFNEDPTMFISGFILMFFLIMVSNAGGLSGGGSNIPVMLIFFGMDMNQAVPISAFVAVCATLSRFVMNFS